MCFAQESFPFYIADSKFKISSRITKDYNPETNTNLTHILFHETGPWKPRTGIETNADNLNLWTLHVFLM
jgi:hypothetical protein